MSHADILSSDQSEVRQSFELRYSRRANTTKKTLLCPQQSGKDSTVHSLEAGLFHSHENTHC